MGQATGSPKGVARVMWPHKYFSIKC